MKRKILAFAAVLLISCLTLSAAEFEGRSTVGFSYSVNIGEQGFGLASDHTGFFNGYSIGYYAGFDADFRLIDSANTRIDFLLAPLYSYAFAEVPVKAEVAAGISFGGNTTGLLYFGFGCYAGACWSYGENLALVVGAKIGSNFVHIPLTGARTHAAGDFYFIPRVALGFLY